LCTNFALDEALGRMVENILLGGATQHQSKKKNRVRESYVGWAVLLTRVKLEVIHADSIVRQFCSTGLRVKDDRCIDSQIAKSSECWLCQSVVQY